MKAMIFAAGLGTRLGNLTKNTPKPMLQVKGFPIMAYVINHLVKNGFNQIVINLHYFPDIIKDYFSDGFNWGAELTYSFEPDLLGTAGGLKKMEKYFEKEDVFLAYYGDIMTNQDISQMIKFHQKNLALSTLLVHQRLNSNSMVEMDENGKITKFIERPKEDERKLISTSWVNSGIFLFNPEIFKFLLPEKPLDIPRDLIIPNLGLGRFFGFPLTGYRCAIDSDLRLKEAQNAVTQGIFGKLQNSKLL